MPTNRRTADAEGADFYPTPRWAIEALLDHERFQGAVLDPACGNGVVVETLKDAGYVAEGSDLFYHGYGETGVDFFEYNYAQNIVTNPPYNVVNEFVEHAIHITESKLALLMRLAFLESGTRYNRIFSKTPPNRIWVFSERITFYPSGIQTAGSGTTAYAWFIWDKLVREGGTDLRWIKPGYKKQSADDKLTVETVS